MKVRFLEGSQRLISSKLDEFAASAVTARR
jgi:hypothetical protein